MILVIGTGRSGTSCIARLLQERLGVDFGGPGKIDEYTPKGGYAREGWMKPSEKFGEGKVGKGGYLEMLDPDPQTLQEPWGFKHPYLCERMEDALDTFNRVTYIDQIIWAWRDPEAVIKSLMHHYGYSRFHASGLEERRTNSIKRALDPRDYIVVNMTGTWDEDWLTKVLYERLHRNEYHLHHELNNPYDDGTIRSRSYTT